jgi:aldehyde:ferredoxin oxidoreductase
MGKNVTYGYAGEILRVNLTNGDISIEPTLNYAKEWLGASGIATRILYNEVKSWVTPYEPANKLIFGAGTLNGTLAPGACRINANSINTLTGGYATSNCDSHFGNELKYAGYDLIIIDGKAHTPIYLWIRDDCIEIRDASNLWGKTTWETLDMIREWHGDKDIHTLSIGPAGENLVRGACIIQDRARAMGRCGLGAVMGSKNLKAIAVRGSGAIQLADPARFMKAVDHCRAMIASRSNTKALMQRLGTPGILPGKQKACGMSYKNFQFLDLPEDLFQSINIDNLSDNYKVREVSYPACAFGCSRYYRIDNGPYAGLRTEGFQFEVVNTLQAKLGIRDPAFMIKANAYCNQMGLDVDLAGGTIGWAMECYQRGILKKSDTDNLELEWGDAEVALELIRKIVYREGFGNILAEGCAKAADMIGMDSGYYAMNIKGQDLFEVCRGAVAWCLAVTTSTRGGGHTTGAPICETIPSADVERAEQVFGITTASDALTYEGKVKLVEYFENLHRVNNCLGICHFNTTWLDVWHIGFPEMAELYSAATGWETSVSDLKRMAKMQLNVEKAFNLLRTDFDRKDDYPTSRDLNEPIPTGALAGWKIERKDYDALLDEYYEMNNWDKETSFPTRKCLEDLGLKDIADDLEKVGKLR